LPNRRLFDLRDGGRSELAGPRTVSAVIRWTNDPKRCREADVPADVRFATKPELAARMLWRTLEGGLKADWVLGESVYGSHRPLRSGLEERMQAYALAGACKEKVEVAGGSRKRVDQVARTLAPTAWQRLCAGDGSKGPRLFDWAQVELSRPEPEGWKRWLVVRRSLDQGPKPAEVGYFLVFAPATTPLWQIVMAIGSRWSVEQCFEEAKGEVGLDEYEVRSFQGWYRHLTLCMLAHAFLTTLRAQSQADLPSEQESEEKKNGTPSRPMLLPRPSPTSNASGDWFARNGCFECCGSATPLLCLAPLSPDLLSLPARLVLFSSYPSGHRSSLSLQASFVYPLSVTTVVLVSIAK
jgi:hypothetical protein